MHASFGRGFVVLYSPISTTHACYWGGMMDTQQALAHMVGVT